MPTPPPSPEPTDPPTPEPPPSAPPSSDPPAALDEATITDLVKKQVTALFKAQPKPEPAAASGPPVDVEAKIKEAIAAAMAERDKEDQVYVLQTQIDELKTSLKNAAPKRGWGAYLLGPGLLR